MWHSFVEKLETLLPYPSISAGRSLNDFSYHKKSVKMFLNHVGYENVLFFVCLLSRTLSSPVMADSPVWLFDSMAEEDVEATERAAQLA